MAETITSPSSRKRTYDGELIEVNNTTASKCNDQANPSLIVERAATPALSVSSSTLSDPLTLTQTPKPPSSISSDSKKRKLTFAEKEVEKAVRKKEKEDRDRQKAEEKQKQDEEKRKRNEEKEAIKRQREIEKAEKQKAKDVVKQEKNAEKAKKDAEKAQKDAERQKKENAQLRIGSFFTRPAPVSTPPTTPDDASPGPASRRSSIASIELPTISPAAKMKHPDYYTWIVPFFVHEHTALAPINRFLQTETNDLALTTPTTIPIAMAQIKQNFPRARSRTKNFRPIKRLIELSQGSAETPIDLSQESPLDELRKISCKILSFREDVRPPYIGTYTRAVSPRSGRKLSRNPFHRGLPETNYDYDSEAEWQEPEEGDVDLNDEDELSEDEEGEEEMDDFLDDEGDMVKRRIQLGESEPVSSGLVWAGVEGTKQAEFDCYRLRTLHDSLSFPLDPHSTKHWADQEKPAIIKPVTTASASTVFGNISMQPPRLPLATINAPNATNVDKSKSRASNSNKQPRMIPQDLLPAFKDAVKGSDLTKAGLIEVLKKRFPQCPKDAIKDTLTAVAVRQGSKEVEKTWVILPTNDD